MIEETYKITGDTKTVHREQLFSVSSNARPVDHQMKLVASSKEGKTLFHITHSKGMKHFAARKNVYINSKSSATDS